MAVTSILTDNLNGVLSHLPPSPDGKRGWPWTQEVDPGIYDLKIKWPRLSILTPSYNQGQYIEETIRSILLQNYPNLEYIIIDGGSTDNTIEIIKKYSQWITNWESEKDNGQSDAINKGFKKYSGEIFAWLNSDDTYLEGALKKGIDYFLSHPETAIVYGDALVTDADGTAREKSKPQPPFDYFNFVKDCENRIAQPSSFILSDVIKKLIDLDVKYYYCLDWDFWLRAGIYFKIDYYPELLSTYRMHADSKTIAQSIRAAPELEYMYNKYFLRKDIPEKIRKIRKQAMMNMYFRSAGYFMNGGDKRSAAKKGWAALYANPAGIFSFNNLRKFLYCNFGSIKNQK